MQEEAFGRIAARIAEMVDQSSSLPADIVIVVAAAAAAALAMDFGLLQRPAEVAAAE